MSENQVENKPAVAKETKKVELTIAGLQEDLKNGITRKDQAKKYGVPLAAINRAYKNQPALKGKRVFSPRGGSATQIVFTDADQFAVEATEGEAKSDAPVTGEATTSEAPTSNVQEVSAPEANQTEAPKEEASKGW